MATLNTPIQVSPNPVPTGGVGTIALAFTTSPGTPNKVADVTVTEDGVVVGTGSLTLNGQPAEVVPVVAIGASGQGWEIRTDQGTLAALGANQFSLKY